MMRDPAGNVPEKIKKQLEKIGLWDINPLNLYRITWKNEQKEVGGEFGEANHLVLPSELTGCKAKIIALSGRWFPTKAVWPSTGNFCRGGAYVATLLGSVQ